MHIHKSDVVGKKHPHDGLGGVRAEYPPFEAGFLGEVRQARRVVQVEVRHKQKVDLFCFVLQ